LDLGDEFHRINVLIAFAQGFHRLIRLKSTAAASTNVVMAEESALSPGVGFQKLLHGGRWGDAGWIAHHGNNFGVLSGIFCANHKVNSVPETLLNVCEDFQASVDFLAGIVKIKTGSSRSGDSELFHQRLSAMMASSECDSFLISQSDHIMRVHASK
jgi:hypothetical protein